VIHKFHSREARLGSIFTDQERPSPLDWTAQDFHQKNTPLGRYVGAFFSMQVRQVPPHFLIVNSGRSFVRRRYQAIYVEEESASQPDWSQRGNLLNRPRTQVSSHLALWLVAPVVFDIL